MFLLSWLGPLVPGRIKDVICVFFSDFKANAFNVSLQNIYISLFKFCYEFKDGPVNLSFANF